jgi:iron complex outermembrane recepter protein
MEKKMFNNVRISHPVLATVFFLLSGTLAEAQQHLPTIDVGGARQGTARRSSKPQEARAPASGPREIADNASAGEGGDSGGPVIGPNIGAGPNGEICADGICNNPKSYAAPIESLGTKVNTPVMNTPLNTKTVTQQMLQDQQVTSLDQAIRNVSGVSVTGGGAIGNATGYSGVTIRGFTTGAYYRDGIRVDNFGASFLGVNSLEFANIESIEVLKGPAAILYGAVEPGGILNLNMKEPLAKAGFSVQQQAGSYSAFRTVFDATGPLTKDKDVLYRFIGSYENDGSWQQYAYNKNLMLNPVIKWNIDANTSVRLETQYQNTYLNQNYNVIPYFNTFTPLWLGRNWNWGPPSPLRQTDTFSQVTVRHNINNDWAVKFAAFMQTANTNGAGTSPYFLADCITPGADPYGSCDYGIPGYTSGAVSQNILQYNWNNGQAEYATVVDLTGKFKTGFLDHTLLFGGDYYRYNFKGSNMSANQSGYYSILGAPQLPVLPSQIYPAYANSQQANNVGLYFQDQIVLPYGFHVMGGARFQYVQSAVQATDPSNVCGPYAGPDYTGYGIPCNYQTMTQKGNDVSQRVTPRAGLLWRPYDWVSLYGNYVESYSPNYQGFLVKGTNQPTPPSAGQQEEGGIKLLLLDSKLQVTAAYYHLVKTNIPVGIPNDYVHVELVGQGRSQGPELDIQGELFPGWTVNLAYANTDALVTKSIVGGSVYAPAEGSPFPYVPRNQGSLASNYEFKDGVFRGLKVGARYDYTGYLPFYHLDNSGNYLAYGWGTPSYGLVGVFGGYDFELGQMKVHAQLNVDNLFNKLYFNTGGFGWVPGVLGSATSTLTTGWASNPDNVFGAPRIFRGMIKVAF